MSPFSGVCASAITPHRKEGHEADFGAMLDLIDFLSHGGVSSICLLGSTGEFLNTAISDRIRIVHLGVKRSRVPVLAGVSHSTLDGVLELASEAITSEAAGLLAMPPYFFRYDQADIVEFYTRLAAGLPRRTPLFLYNIPSFTNPIALETAEALLATGRFAGIKDSSGDPAYFAGLQALRPSLEFTLLVGSDEFYPAARAAGADGVVSGCACAVPELLASLDEAIRTGAPTQSLVADLKAFLAWVVQFPTPVAVKTAVALRGIKTGPLSLPLPPEKTVILGEFEKWFKPFAASLPKPPAPPKRK